METILTVLSTIGVGALAYAAAGVIRFSRRVNDLELIRMEIVDLEKYLSTRIEESDRCWQANDSEIHRRIDEGYKESESSLDRRFDNVWSKLHEINNVEKGNKK